MSKLPQRQLGRQGLQVSALGLGCMAFTEFYGDSTTNSDIDGVFSKALELGINFIDTSDAYGPYRNEIAVGKALQGRRHDFVLSTKFGVVREVSEEQGTSNEKVGLCGRPDYVKQACEASLKRLNTDYIDLYIQHRLDPHVPVEETVGAMGDLVKEGKVRHIALCEVGPDSIRRGHASFPLSLVHAEYSLWSRDPEDRILPVLRELGIGFLPYSPLGRGFLTGAIKSEADLAADDWRRNSPRFQGENFKKNLEVVARIQALAEEKGVTSAQLALSWILHQGDFIVPLQGATNIEQLEENSKSAFIELSSDELATIDAICPKGVAAGSGWPEGSAGSKVSDS